MPTLAEYTSGCEAALGPLPALDCGELPLVEQQATLMDGSVVPIRAAIDVAPEGTCDRPSFLSGCVGGSRAGVLTNDAGSLFWLSCRVTEPFTPPGWYDDVALIGRAEDGTTCMWGVPPFQLRDGSALPHPGQGPGFWADVPEIAAVACRECHEGNAVVVTPWIAANLGQALPPTAPTQVLYAEALATIDPTWRSNARWVHPEAAPCRACHELHEGPACLLGPGATGRLTDPMLSRALAQWPTDRWMDELDPNDLAAAHVDEAGWEATYGAAADRLLACCGGLREGCWEE